MCDLSFTVLRCKVRYSRCRKVKVHDLSPPGDDDEMLGESAVTVFVGKVQIGEVREALSLDGGVVRTGERGLHDGGL